MPLLAPASRRAPSTRALLTAFYLLLVAGSLTMVYPFLLMVAGTTKSQVDEHEFKVVPTFLREDRVLYRKHIEALCNENLVACRVAHDRDLPSFAKLEPPAPVPPGLLEAWVSFASSPHLPDTLWTLGLIESPVSKTLCANLRAFKQQVSRAHGGRLDEVNRALGTEFPTWSAFDLDAENLLSRREKWTGTPLQRAVQAFKHGRPFGERIYFRVEGYFHQEFLKPLHGRDIAAYNRAHGTSFATFEQIPLPEAAPADPAARADWEEFVRSLLNPLWIHATPECAPAYRAYLVAKYGSLAALGRAYGRSFAREEDILLPSRAISLPPLEPTPPTADSSRPGGWVQAEPVPGLVASDWESFLAGWKDPDTGVLHRADVAHLRIQGVETLFRRHLARLHPSLDALNAAWGTHFRDWSEIHPPQEEAHHRHYVENRRAIRLEFCTRGFRHVLDYLWVHGRAVLNTAIYCGLSVLLALVINPLAAYALSRFRLRNRHHTLFFLLLTMAFPPMVTQIPVFLMLRDFGLLNSFAALLLPHLAHGYSIFLLKGFFDSLPRELYESAEIDGAGEWTLFWHMTLALSKPILAVVALTAFTSAYGNFMFALLLCQDPRMWTVMVWLFKLQQESGDAVVYASLLLAAVPTFLLFAFCQKIILRGLIIPMDK